MNIFFVCGISLTAALFALFLKKDNPIAIAVSIISGIVIVFHSISYFKSITDYIKEISYSVNLSYSFFVPVLKMTAVSYIGEIFCATLNDSGLSSLSKQLETAIKIIVTVMALPIFKEAFSVIVSIME